MNDDADEIRKYEASEKRKQRQRMLSFNADETRKLEVTKKRNQRERKLIDNADEIRKQAGAELCQAQAWIRIGFELRIHRFESHFLIEP